MLSTHVYAQLTGWPTWERSYPEDTRLPNYLNEVQALINWRNQYRTRQAGVGHRVRLRLDHQAQSHQR